MVKFDEHIFQRGWNPPSRFSFGLSYAAMLMGSFYCWRASTFLCRMYSRLTERGTTVFYHVLTFFPTNKKTARKKRKHKNFAVTIATKKKYSMDSLFPSDLMATLKGATFLVGFQDQTIQCLMEALSLYLSKSRPLETPLRSESHKFLFLHRQKWSEGQTLNIWVFP